MTPETTKFQSVNYIEDAPMEENPRSLSAISSDLGSIVSGSIAGKNVETIANAIDASGGFQTGESGQRTTIGGLSIGIQIYDTDQSGAIATIHPVDTGTLFTATSPNVADRMFSFIEFVQQGYQANPMVYLQADDVNVGTIPLSIVQKGDKTALTIDHPATSGGSGIVITHLGDGICGDFYIQNTGAVNPTVRIRSIATASTAYPLSVYNNGSALATIYAETDKAGTYAGYFKQNHKISGSPAHFSRLFQIETDSYSMVWFMSDRTSPDGLLAGAIGDICFNGDGGKVYYCTGSTAWTAL